MQEAKKAEKQKQIKKQKANLQAQRNEKLARRNPHRIQRDIDTLKELDQSVGVATLYNSLSTGMAFC